MTEDWNTTDELRKDIITAVYKDINDQIEEMIEDIGCPRSFAEGLLISIADNFKDGTTVGKTESSYSSRHASTPEHERGCLLYTSPSPRDLSTSRMPSSA